MNEYEKTKKWLADYLKCQFVSENAPDDECVREAEFVLSNPLIQIKADEQNVDLSFLLNTGSTVPIQVRTVDAMLKENWVKVVDKEATNG